MKHNPDGNVVDVHNTDIVNNNAVSNNSSKINSNDNNLQSQAKSTDVGAQDVAFLLVQLAELNIRIRIKEGNLHLNASPGVLSSELLGEIKAKKSGIIAAIQQNQASETFDQFPTLRLDETHRYEAFPLSEVQHAYWIGRSTAIELGGVATHYYYELICKDLNLPIFVQALRKIIERHDMLRAVVIDEGKQAVLPQVPPYEVKTYDLQSLSAAECQARQTALRAEMSAQMIPADQWPLFDIRAVILPGGETQLYFSWDFINLDAWSIYAICREWKILYQNLQAQLPPIRISYRDYLLAERELRSGKLYQRDKAYWWNRIDSIPPAPGLPVQVKSANGEKHIFTRRRFRLSKQKWQQVKQRGASIGVTASNILLTAFSDVLALWSKEPHFTLNMTFFNRLPLHEDVYKLVGDFTSLTMLEIDFRTPMTFAERAIKVQSQFMKDFEHRTFSGVEVMREWAKRRNSALQASMPVVFTSCLVLNSSEGDDSGLLENFGKMVYGISQTPQVWLDNQIMEDADGLVLNWDAVEEVFAPGVLDAMFAAYGQTLESLAVEEGAWKQNHLVHLPSDQHEIREVINQTRFPLPQKCLHADFVQYALANPGAVAIKTSGAKITYGELLQRSQWLAQELRRGTTAARAGTQPPIVAVIIEKSWQQVVAVMGVLLAGCAYMPVDPDLPEARMRLLFEQSGATQAVLADAAVKAKLPQEVEVFSTNKNTSEISTGESFRIMQSVEDLAYVIFTSGSTGIPKGVMIDHAGAVNTVEAINRLFQVTSSDSVLAISSLSFDLSVYDIFGLLSVGGCLVIPDADKTTDPEHWLNLMEDHSITLWNSAPPLMTMLMNFMTGFHRTGNSHLRLVMLSGDWIPLDIHSKIIGRFPRAKLVSLGGATEASIWSIYFPVNRIEENWKSIPYGKALPNQTMHVLNREFHECPDYTIGQIYIGGKGLAMGYLNDSEKTQKHFVHSPITGERLYYTGDLGRYLPDGNIEFLGREDSQVKLRGHRIELGEIASVLTSHPAVAQAVAVIEGDRKEEQQLWAFLILDELHRSALTKVIEADAAQVLPAPRNLRESLVPLNGDPKTHLTLGYRDMWAELDKLYDIALINLFVSSGTFTPGKAYSLNDVVVENGFASRYHRWTLRALNHLCDLGLMQQQNGQFSLVENLTTGDLSVQAKFCEALLTRVMGLDPHEACWFTLGALRLKEILREEFHSAELYTAEETAVIYQKLFRDSHDQLTELTRLLAGNTKHLNILEVGAGLGSASQHLIPALASVCNRYVFTDISQYFLRRAKDLFSQFSFVEYELCNLDVSPEIQGFENGTYDVIYASSVLHDVSDIKRTLRYLRSLLAPGGLLVFLEETKFWRSFDLTMGLQQGFDTFADTAVREHNPLIARKQWELLLKEVGFIDTAVLNIDNSTMDHVGFDVFIAQAPLRIEMLDEQLLDAHVSERLPSYMRPYGYQVIDKFPLTSSGKIDYKSLGRPKKRKADMAARDLPRNELEKSIAAIWQKVLGKSDFGVNSSFFDVGGDSLLLVEVRTLIMQETGRNIPTTVLFEHPTVAALATYFAADTSDNSSTDDLKTRTSKQKQALRARKNAAKGEKENV